MNTKAHTWFVIVNPIAGFGKGLKRWNRILPLLSNNLQMEVHFTAYDGHASILTAEAIGSGYKKLLAVGGDGTLHQVVNGIMLQQHVPTKDVVISFLSCGTGNDWVRSFNFPTSDVAFVEMLKTGKQYTQDVGVVKYIKEGLTHTKYFNNIAGVGFDAYVVQQTSNKVGGKFSYFINMIKSLFSYTCVRLKLNINGEEIVATSYLTLSAINKYAGGGMLLAPHAINNDALLDVVLVREMSKPSVLRHLAKLFDGSYLKLEEVRCFKTEAFSLEVLDNSANIVCEADGEIIGHGPFLFSLIPDALSVVVP